MQNVEWDGNVVPPVWCKIFVCATADQLGSRLCDFAEKEVYVISHFYHERDVGIVVSHPTIGVGAFLFFKGNKTFRPIKSEREKAIDAAFKVFDEKSHIYPPTEQKFLNEFVSSLYDAGMLKLPD